MRSITALKSVLIAFSGGVDSTLLLKLSHHALNDRVVAVTMVSALQPAREREAAMEQVRTMGVRHITIHGRALEDAAFVKNDRDRCYRCKHFLFKKLLSMAQELDVAHVAHGANVDDLKDYRPGFKAADELGIVAPLLDAGLGKRDIRVLSKQLNLSTWDKPAMACLASRIPHGTSLSKKKLAMVERAEEVLHGLGFKHCRVRHHGNLARIEVSPAAFPDILTEMTAEHIVRLLRGLGYQYVSLDMEGYTQGSMNPEDV